MEFKELFTELNEIKIKISTYNAEVNAQNTITNAKLISIDNSLIKLNSKIADHERRIQPIENHTTCPHADKIRILEDSKLEAKTIKRWLISTVAITGTVMGILAILFKFITTV